MGNRGSTAPGETTDMSLEFLHWMLCSGEQSVQCMQYMHNWKHCKSAANRTNGEERVQSLYCMSVLCWGQQSVAIESAISRSCQLKIELIFSARTVELVSLGIKHWHWHWRCSLCTVCWCVRSQRQLSLWYSHSLLSYETSVLCISSLWLTFI